MSLKVIGIQIENFQKIKTFLLKPEGNVIKITGGNGAGKSSVLDAIWLALAGARGGPSAPVRQGAGRGVVRLDLGDIRVTRMWTEGGDSKGEMYIEAEDGRRYGTPQRMLDALMGQISFDPLAFIHMDVKQKSEELRKLLNIDEALTAIRADEANDYTTRRELNKAMKAREAQRANVHVPEGLPDKKRDIDAMIEELGKVAEFNIAIDRERMRRDQRATERYNKSKEVLLIANEIGSLQQRIAGLERSKDVARAEHDAIEAEIAKWNPLDEPKDAQALSEELNAARGINAGIDRRDQAARMDAEIEEMNKSLTNLDKAISTHRANAAKLIAEADYPVEGLGFKDDEVMYNGLPFAQASNAEQIKVSIAMGMALNPKIRIMRIKDGSLLDENSVAVVEAMAAHEDFQVWMELVDSSGKVGVYLEDGEIAKIDGEVREPLKLKPHIGPARKKPVKKVKEETF